MAAALRILGTPAPPIFDRGAARGAVARAALLLTLAAATCVSTARAQPASALLEAERALARGETEAAAEGFDAALASGSLEREQLVRAHAGLGAIAAAQGDLESVAASFARVLALDPRAPSPAGLTPEASSVIEALRTQRDGRGLRLGLRSSSPPPRGTPLALEVTMEGVPADWASRIAVEGLLWSRRFELSASGGGASVLVREEAWQDTALSLTVTLEDGYGNPLAQAQFELERAAELPPPALEDAAEEPAPLVRTVPATGPEWYESPLVWVLVGVAVLGAAIGIGAGVALSPQQVVVGTPSVRVAP